MVVVCPYRDATQSGVVLSAFAFGVPVIAKRTGILLQTDDVPALAEALERIICDPAFAMQLSRNIADAASHEFHRAAHG